MKTTFSYCRACSGGCGVVVENKKGETHLSGDRANPKNAGFLCALASASWKQCQSPDRFTQPMKRTPEGLKAVSWDQANSEIGAALKAIRKAHGTDALGLFAGAPLAANPLGACRTAAFALGLGTPHFYSTLALHGAPQLIAAEKMLGTPMALQADVGRAHYTILLGDCDQDVAGWGPLQSGTIHTQALKHIQGMRRSAKLVAVGSRKSALAELADQSVSIRPGTETVFLLGLCQATWNGGWSDGQYLRDYTVNSDRLGALLEPWTPAAVGEICDIDPSVVSGIALKFSRAPMATVAKSAALFAHKDGTVAAWAWHLLHALTANLLRPGGAFEGVGPIDLLAAQVAFPTENAPQTRVSRHPALFLQMPATSLTEEIEQEGKGQLRALICVAGDPVGSLPQPAATQAALQSLDLLVCVDIQPSETTALADWILPATAFWERDDFHFLDGPLLPYKHLQATRALQTAPGQSRPEETILSDLFKATGAPLWGGAWGTHLKGIGRWLATTNLEAQANRLLKWSTNTDLEQLRDMPHGLDQGELDRSHWRPTTPNDQINLVPDDLEQAIRDYKPEAIDPEAPYSLNSTGLPPAGRGGWVRKGDKTHAGIGLHPDCGFTDGQRIRVQSQSGSLLGTVRLDEALHPNAISIPWGWELDVGALIPGDERDPFTGTPAMVGVACTVSLA
jgi:anaerobic selenocysteine-containing dehydrogenase